MKLLRFFTIAFMGIWSISSINGYASVDSLQAVLDTLTNQEQQMIVMLDLGKQLKDTAPNQALTYYNSALQIADYQEDEKSAYQIHFDIGRLFEAQEKNAKAVVAYRKALGIAEKIKAENLQANAHLYLGDIHMKLQKTDVAIPSYLKAKRIFETQKTRQAKKKLGQTLKKIGESYQAKGRIDAAIQYNLLALDIFVVFKKGGDFAGALENLGELYFENSEYGRSVNYYRRSIQLFEKLQSDVDFEYLYRRMGEAQKLSGEDIAAEKSFEISAQYASAKLEVEKMKLEELEKSLEKSVDNDSIVMVDTACIEDKEIRFEEEVFSASDSFVMWTTPKIDNKPMSTQTISNAVVRNNANDENSMAAWKIGLMGLGILALGVLLGFLWCIQQYKKKWQELQNYMEDKDEKLLQQSREIKILEKELRFFNQALYKGLQMPATNVKVTSNLLKEKYNGSLDKEGSKYIKQIQQSATNLEGLLTAIFNFQQIKHYGLQLKEVNVSRMAKEIATELKRMYPKREIRFWVQEDMKINADEELVRLLLANLLHNALKFTKKNPISIIEFGKKEHIFYIKDNGEGFHPQEAKVLFETFEPLKNTKNFEELTVSLLSMQTIVQKHAGTIWTVSQKEKGTTFFFTLDATPVKNGATDFWNLSKSPHFKLTL